MYNLADDCLHASTGECGPTTRLIRGMCGRHYSRVLKTGTHLKRETGWRTMFVTQDDGCWRWTGAVANSGYGTFCVRPLPTQLAHRYVYKEIKGPIPEGMDLDHLCR